MHNINYNNEHIMYRYLESFSLPFHRWETLNSLICLFESSLNLIWSVVWYLRSKIVKYIIVMYKTWTYLKIWKKLSITHDIKRINDSIIWWVTHEQLFPSFDRKKLFMNPYIHELKIGKNGLIVNYYHHLLSLHSV